MSRTFLRVRGRLKPDGAYHALPGWETQRLLRGCRQASSLSLILFDAAGAVRTEGSVVLDTALCEPFPKTGGMVARLSGHIALVPEVTRLVLCRDGEVLHEAPVAAEQPRLSAVRVTPESGDRWRVDWDATHDLPLTFQIAFVDPQRRLFPVARGIDSNSFTLDADNLPGGRACHVAVLATDGVRSAAARSEPFDVAPKSAALVMIAPEPETHLLPGQPFSLLGFARDIAGTSLPDAGLVWSIDGEQVASGLRLALGRALPAGEHVIELAYSDGDGRHQAVLRRSLLVSTPPRPVGEALPGVV